MEVDDFLLTPGSVLGPSGGRTLDREASSARKELRFDEDSKPPVPPELDAPYLLGNNLLEWDDEVVTQREAESDVATDLLWGLLGIGRQGSCLSGPAPRLPAAVASAVSKVRPVCVTYAFCLRLVHRWGLLGEARCLAKEGLAWAVDAMLQQHRAAVLLLEQQVLAGPPVAAIPRILRASMVMMPHLARLQKALVAAQPLSGSAEVMQALHDMWQAAVEPEARQSFSFLLYSASKPYFARLGSWIGGDDLRDSFDELCVARDETMLRVTPRYLPRFLSKEMAQQLMTCGQHSHLLLKLLLKEMSHEAKMERILAEKPLIEERDLLPEWTPESSGRWRVAVGQLCEDLGRQVLQVIRKDDMLVRGLSAIATVCLMQPSGVWLRDLDSAMKTPVLDASLPHLQELVNMSLGCEWARVVLWPLPLSEERTLLVTASGAWRGAAESSSGVPAVNLTVRESLGLVCDPPPGLALFVPPSAMRAYALAFRRLLQYDNSARLLGRAWRGLAKQLPPHSAASGLAVARVCRATVVALQKHYLQTCHAPAWAALMANARHAAASLEQVSQSHSKHLRVVLCGLFLTVSPATAEAVQMVLDTCDAFGSFAVRVAAACEQGDAAAALVEAQYGDKCEAVRGLSAAAVGALVQQIRGDPACEVLLYDLTAATTVEA